MSDILTEIAGAVRMRWLFGRTLRFVLVPYSRRAELLSHPRIRELEYMSTDCFEIIVDATVVRFWSGDTIEVLA